MRTPLFSAWMVTISLLGAVPAWAEKPAATAIELRTAASVLKHLGNSVSTAAILERSIDVLGWPGRDHPKTTQKELCRPADGGGVIALTGIMPTLRSLNQALNLSRNYSAVADGVSGVAALRAQREKEVTRFSWELLAASQEFCSKEPIQDMSRRIDGNASVLAHRIAKVQAAAYIADRMLASQIALIRQAAEERERADAEAEAAPPSVPASSESAQ